MLFQLLLTKQLKNNKDDTISATISYDKANSLNELDVTATTVAKSASTSQSSSHSLNFKHQSIFKHWLIFKHRFIFSFKQLQK
nr:BPK_HP1_G0043730.mRNA.1.CDS.1 [Saccharomyces cerevisiae]